MEEPSEIVGSGLRSNRRINTYVRYMFVSSLIIMLNIFLRSTGGLCLVTVYLMLNLFF